MEEEKKKLDFTSKMRGNPWIVSTIVLGFAFLIMLFFLLKPGITGNIVSGQEAGEKVVEYLNTRTGGGVEYVSYEDLGNLYEITCSYKGQEIPVYSTKDGKYFVQGITPITGKAIQTQEQAEQEIVKSDKPKVEAFVFSYCPYGLQFEKALLPVYKILKNKADINIVFIGAMHGEYEKIESVRQLCIEKEYGKDKFWLYLEKFMGDEKIGDCEDNMECSKPLVESIIAGLGIDKNKINLCMEKDGEILYQAQNNRAEELGIGGSPTFVVNNAEIQAGRSPEEIKKIVCSAFNKEPEECKQTLSNQQAAPWFGYADGGSSTSAGSC